MTILHQNIDNIKTLVDRIDTIIVLDLIIMFIGQDPLRCVHILKIREKKSSNSMIYRSYIFMKKEAHVPHC